MPYKTTTFFQKKSLWISFTNKAITPWGGLVAFCQFAQGRQVSELWKKNLPFTVTSPNAFDPCQILMVFACGVLTGARRFAHISRLRYDLTLIRLLGLGRMPSEDTAIRLFQRFERKEVEAFFPPLFQWNLQQLPARPEGYTLDLDSSVFERYGQQEGAKKGYNPKKPGRPSHHPIFAVLAESLTLAHTWLRSGNTASARGASQFLSETLANLPDHIQITALRGDSGFCDGKFLDFLEEDKPLPYVIVARFTGGLQAKATQVAHWESVDDGIQIAEVQFQADGWKKVRRVILVRKQVSRTGNARGKILRLFNDPDYRWEAYVTNRTEFAVDLWRFYRGRANIENRIKELRYDWGLDGFCLQKFDATEAALRFIVWLHNLLLEFLKAFRLGTHKTLASLRFQLLACGALLGRQGHCPSLRLSLQGPWRARLEAFFSSTTANCAAVETG